MVSGMDKATIIRLHEAGFSNRSIARELSLARQTFDNYIKRYKKEKTELADTDDPVAVAELQQSMLTQNKMDVSRRKSLKFTGDLAARFYEIVALNEERNKVLGPNKQEINGAIIHRQLRREGFLIGESTIRAKWSEYRHSQQEVFIKQTYEYGERADFDFHQIKVVINGQVRVYHQATISCPKSNFVFIKLNHDQSQKSVLNSLVEFFRYCGGVFAEITFDNMKPVVATYGNKRRKKYTEEIIKFAAYYGFNINTTNARKGNEKGHVENGGKLVRKELFALNYGFENEEALFAYVADTLEEANRPILGAFDEETKHLKPLPVHDYNLGEFGIGKANSYCFVMVATNYYSIPEEYVFKEVRYSIISDLIVFYRGNKEIARHKRLNGKDGYRVNIKHYLKTLMKKPGAVSRSLALRSADQEIIRIFEQRFKDNPRGFIEYLYNENSAEKVEQITIETLSSNQLGNINKTFNLTGANA